MKKNILLSSIILIQIFSQSCKNEQNILKESSKPITAEIIYDGYFQCFEDSLMQDNGKPFTCEPSTVVYLNNKVFIANDKVFPFNNSSLFCFILQDTSSLDNYTNFTDSIFYLVNKYEASTHTLDKKFIIFSSAYSYATSHPEHGQKYNTTIYFNPDDISNNGILHFAKNSGFSSVDVKEGIKSALKSDSFPNGPDYLKLEGMAIFPDNKLIFGIREFGDAYDDFQYTITFLQANFQQTDTNIELTSEITKTYDFFPSDTLDILFPLGLSSVEFNWFDSTIYFVTSHETGHFTSEICSYVWYISIDDFFNQKPAEILKDKNNEPLKFIHKIEGLTIIDKNTLLLIADDDRITGVGETNPSFTRSLNEAYWCVVKIKGDINTAL